MEFKLGTIYSFHDLKNYFGQEKSYSFQKNSVVTALIVNGELNPEFLNKAPVRGEILVAEGWLREGVAKKMKNSSKPFPTFVKVETNKWIYTGEYYFFDYITKEMDIDRVTSQAKRAKRKLAEVVGIIYLNRADAEVVIFRKQKVA